MKRFPWTICVFVIVIAVAVAIIPHAKTYLQARLDDAVQAAVGKAVVETVDKHEQQWMSRDRNIEVCLNRLATEESAAFVGKHLPTTPAFSDRVALFEKCLASIPTELKEGLYCEFGVGKGTTINQIAARTDHLVHGFDSFEGLPEDWRTGFSKGHFAMPGLPEVRENVQLYKGWFNESVPVWAKEHPGPMAFMHMDADLYSSTKCVLDLLADRIVPGTVLQFDEYLNYPGWQDGESKAFGEFVQARQIEFEYLGYCPGSQQVAVKITKVGGR